MPKNGPILFWNKLTMSYKLHSSCPSASLIKQLAAMVYDSLLIIAILFVATAVMLPFNKGEAIVGNFLFSMILILIIFCFYSWFWNKSGQTLGMRVWKIRIVSELGGNPSWAVSFLRLVFAILSLSCLGLGYWWRLFRPYTWHDKLSLTRIVDVSELPREQQ